MVPKVFLLVLLLTAAAVSEGHRHKSGHSFENSNQQESQETRRYPRTDPYPYDPYIYRKSTPAPETRHYEKRQQGSYDSSSEENDYQQTGKAWQYGQRNLDYEQNQEQQNSNYLRVKYSASPDQNGKSSEEQGSREFRKVIEVNGKKIFVSSKRSHLQHSPDQKSSIPYDKHSHESQESSESQHQSQEQVNGWNNNQNGYYKAAGSVEAGQNYPGSQQSSSEEVYNRNKYEQNPLGIYSGKYSDRFKPRPQHYSDESFEIRQAEKQAVWHPDQDLGGRFVENYQKSRHDSSEEDWFNEKQQDSSRNFIGAQL